MSTEKFAASKTQKVSISSRTILQSSADVFCGCPPTLHCATITVTII